MRFSDLSMPRNVCITLQSMWSTAKAWGYVAHNLMEGVVLPDVKRVQRFFLSQREIQLILAKAQEPYRTWYGLAAETGLRAGELCGLTVDDIDLERVVELSPQACAHMGKFLESWHPNQRRLLFATRTGTPWDQNLLLKRSSDLCFGPSPSWCHAVMASMLSGMRTQL